MERAKTITVWKALFVLTVLVVSLVYTIQVVEGSIHIPILFSAAVAGVVGYMSGFRYEEMEEGILDTIRMALQAILIMLVIGMIVGVWITSGIVPTMIYYGLKILSPGIFLLATCLICSIVSLATGSSWTTAATVGIALIGVGSGLEIPLPMVAGAIISGAYFGDKMSPLSDTTNLAPAMAGATLFDHIKHMIYTTGPSYVIALVLFGILGLKFAGKEMNYDGINQLLGAMDGAFNINPLLLLVPVAVIAMVVLKVPAVPGLFSGVILGGIFGMIFQGISLGDIFSTAYSGYTSETGVEFVDNLLTRGGITGMYSTIALILCAMCFGGIMDKTGMLRVLAMEILKFAKSTGSLVTCTVLTCIFTNFVAGDQYLSIVLPGRMYKEMFDQQGLKPKNLSRTLEDAGTITSPLCPWNTCGAYMHAALSVHPFAYLPYAFFNIINPLVSILFAYLGWFQEKMSDEEYQAYLSRKSVA